MKHDRNFVYITIAEETERGERLRGMLHSAKVSSSQLKNSISDLLKSQQG